MTYLPSDYTGTSTFVHLHNHTLYSALDGVSTPSQYARECATRGYPAMSATEHGHMGSVPDMYLSFKENKVKYIAGCEIYYCDWEPKRRELANNGVTVRSIKQSDPVLYSRIARNRHLTILAKNEIGYQNLIKLTTQAYDTGLFGMGRVKYPRIWFDKLCEFKEGLIVLSGCLNGPVCHELRMRELKDKDGNVIWTRPMVEAVTDAVKYIRKFKEVFKDDYYVELQMPGIPGDDFVFRTLIDIADRFKLPIVLANDVHYLKREDFQLQTIMMAVEQGVRVDDPNLFHVNSDEQFMKTRGELWSTFKNGEYCRGIDDGKFEEMCDNTLKIADLCQPLKIDPSPKTPSFENADSELRRLVAQRLRALGLDKCTKKFLIDGREVTYVDQAKIELNRFIDKGFASYFLITRDIVAYGKERGWPFSPRGSAGGSLVCYLLDIHSINPMHWNLSFDRFMSESRGGYMLNIQMDPNSEIKAA